MNDRYTGKCCRLVRRIERVVAIGLLLIKSPRVTSKEVEYEDKVVGFGEDRMDL